MHPACPRVERREARGEEDAAQPGSFRWESTAGSCYEVGGRKTQLGQGLHWVTSGLGKLRGREAASLRRDLRPTRVEAAVSHSQLHRRHERPAEATDALRPGCRGRDAGRTSTQALRTKRKTHSVPGVQRKKRSTPTAEQVSSGRRAYHSNRRTGVQRKKGLSLQPPDEAANEGLNHSVHRPALRAKGLSLRIGSVPSWATFRCNPG